MNTNPTDDELKVLFQRTGETAFLDNLAEVGYNRLIFNECLALATRGDATICPKCNDGVLVKLRSQRVKQCTGCTYSEPWELKDGQLPQIGNNRQRIKSKQE